MTKRQEKKAEKLKREAIHKVLDLVLDINGSQASNRDITGDHPTAFLYISGHVASIDIDIHTKGWCADDRPDIKIYTHMGEDLSGAIQELDKTKSALKERGVRIG